MKISVIITLKKDVLDPQGKVIHQTLDGMGFNDVNEVRQGKYFEIDTKESDQNKAKEKVEEMCKKLLANLVIENYKIIDATPFGIWPSFSIASAAAISTSSQI